MPDNNYVFPILDRRAPLLERVRDDNDEQQLTNLVSDMISEAVKSDDDELLEETHENIVSGIRQNLADNLGVDAEQIDADFAERVADVLVDADESDVLTEDAAEALGIRVDDDDDVDDEDSSELFD